MKGELTKEFKRKDSDKAGTITATHWCEIMKSVTGLDLPWRTLKPKLVTGAAGDINKVASIPSIEVLTANVCYYYHHEVFVLV